MFDFSTAGTDEPVLRRPSRSDRVVRRRSGSSGSCLSLSFLSSPVACTLLSPAVGLGAGDWGAGLFASAFPCEGASLLVSSLGFIGSVGWSSLSLASARGRLSGFAVAGLPASGVGLKFDVAARPGCAVGDQGVDVFVIVVEPFGMVEDEVAVDQVVEHQGAFLRCRPGPSDSFSTLM